MTTPTCLLLPAASSPSVSLTSLISFWRPALSAAYTRIPPTALLYIGASPPFQTKSRRHSFHAAQKLLAALYGVVYNLSVEHAKEGVDVRIVFLSSSEDTEAGFGPVVSVEQLAGLKEWEVVLVGRGEGGYQMQGQFLGATMASVRVFYLELGAGEEKEGEGEGDGPLCGEGVEAGSEEEFAEHEVVAVGGTFDHLHLGHKLLLTCTAYIRSVDAVDTRLIIGLTGPEMLKNKKFAEYMESWKVRAEGTLEFVRGIVDTTPCEDAERNMPVVEEKEGSVVVTLKEWTEDEEGGKKLVLDMVELMDPFGPTITEEAVTALVATLETESGAEAVNQKRVEEGWRKLEVGVVGLLMDVQSGDKLSSTELRKKEGEGKSANL